MRDLRIAESSNAAAMELMAGHAVTPDGEPMPFADAMAQLDEMDMIEFYQAYAAFIQAIVPNASGRR